MKSASLALAAFLTFAASGAHAQMLKLTQPADLNKDGVQVDMNMSHVAARQELRVLLDAISKAQAGGHRAA